MNMKNKHFFTLILIIVIRILSVFLVTTSFVPDEYWQSLEVAHYMNFGYGYLTWEWRKKIRSIIYPYIFYLQYKLLPCSHTVLVKTPRIFQALLSSIGDFYTYKLSIKLFGVTCGWYTLFNILSSWFLFYCSSRTISNMAETALTSCGLYFYPWNNGKYKGLSFVIFLLICDKSFYGEWVFTPYNFFLFNWKNDIGAFYGSHPMTWYLFIGLPIVLGGHLVPFLLGVFSKPIRSFYFYIIWMIAVFSIPSHKEFRFLLPILPLAMVLCGATMKEIASGRKYIFHHKISQKLNTVLCAVILLVNVPLMVYMGMFHQRGTLDASAHLAETVCEDSRVLFAMPCHSAPFYSYVHRNISMKFLTCEPNFDNASNYTDEADTFFMDPQRWLSEYYADQKGNLEQIPSHIVAFSSLYPAIKQFLETHRYELCYRTFHAHFYEGRTGGFVEIYCK